MTIVEMHVNIDCDGCEDNVRKALLRLEGVHHVQIDRMHGKVTVNGSVSQKKVLRAARRTGRLAVLWPSAFNPAYNHGYAQPAYYQYQAKPAAAHAHAHGQQQQHYYSGSAERGKNGSVSAVGRKPAAHYPQGRPSSYNYQVHGYYDSDLYGSYREQPDVVPVAVRSYFSDENPNACSIM
ncbi:heavy metal-associated isoprenylated plant protein 28-like [Phragmites australis]|uniref:heavy metal-associated isoprenylated plant protein 28-like n=1 Tax=Phragmites australis TaxID=29695 RepID=UPI002D78B10F|nr:heavy metal-associated isoprenylated plant protein 28-like [Phragmites australis]